MGFSGTERERVSIRIHVWSTVAPRNLSEVIAHCCEPMTTPEKTTKHSCNPKKNAKSRDMPIEIIKRRRTNVEKVQLCMNLFILICLNKKIKDGGVHINLLRGLHNACCRLRCNTIKAYQYIKTSN